MRAFDYYRFNEVDMLEHVVSLDHRFDSEAIADAVRLGDIALVTVKGKILWVRPANEIQL